MQNTDHTYSPIFGYAATQAIKDAEAKERRAMIWQLAAIVYCIIFLIAFWW